MERSLNMKALLRRLHTGDHERDAIPTSIQSSVQHLTYGVSQVL